MGFFVCFLQYHDPEKNLGGFIYQVAAYVDMLVSRGVFFSATEGLEVGGGFFFRTQSCCLM